MELKTYIRIISNKILRNSSSIRRVVYLNYKIHPKPIFVLGNQKSGTSAIASLLGKASGLDYTIDLGGFTSSVIESIYQNDFSLKYAAEKYAKIEFSRPIIKEPNLTFLFNKLISEFSNSKFVFIVREPASNIRSILNRLGIPGHLKQITPIDYPEINPIWEKILYNDWVGKSSKFHLSTLAQRWNEAAEIYFNNQEKFELIRFEDFKKDKISQIYNLASRIDIPIRNDIKKYVNRQYQIKGNNSLSLKDFFGEENLREIRQICKDAMIKFNYTND